MIEPYTVHRPAGAPVLVYDSPHSGRYYPPDFEPGAPLADLRRGEDAYVDQLLAGATAYGAVVLAANYPRCYIDVNRAETDIDATLLAEPWPGPIEPTEKTERGLGLIRRYVVPGVEAQARPLTAAALRARLDRVYRPYHAMLAALVEQVRAARGTVVHVNWHSMKSRGNAMTPDGPGVERADVVVSDVHGRSAAGRVRELIVGALEEAGWRVAVNEPYAGGTIVQRTGAPDRGVHSVQIEINRALYLDESTVEPTSGFADAARVIALVTQRLAEDARSR